MSNEKGYSLVELVVVMGIFTIVTIITTQAFDRLVSTGSQLSKSSASQIDGIVGLEMLRRDLSHAGYGLPWSTLNPPTSPFNEVANAPAGYIGMASATAFNETIPHALSCAPAASGSTNPGTDYLVIKSVLLPLKASNSTAGRWGPLNYATTPAGDRASYVKRVGDPDGSDLRSGSNDNVIIVASSISGSGSQNRQLLNPGAGINSASFSYAIADSEFKPPLDFQPADPGSSYIVYGIANRSLRMPYNRADYYVNRPAADDANFKIPQSCNPRTGILFKAVADHDGGYTTPYPLLNCVGDMKVVYAMDQAGDGAISYFPATSAAIAALTPEQLRTQLKSVTVYILSHEGGRDRSYTYPSSTVFLGPMIGTTQLASVGKVWSEDQMRGQFGPDWKNYRWKVYALAVSPRNMQN